MTRARSPMRILLISHYYAPEFGAPQRRWSALVRRFVAAGHQVNVVAPVPHYPSGHPDPGDGARHRPGTIEVGENGETILRTAYLPHGPDILTRSVDQAVAAGDALWRILHRFDRPGTRPDVVIATAPAIASLGVGRVAARLWRVPLVVEMRDAWPDLVAHVGSPSLTPPPPRPPTLTAERETVRRAAHALVAAAKADVHLRISAWQRGADAVVTTTERFADVLRSRGIRRVEVVRNGTDVASVPAQQDHVPPHRELRCLYLGNQGISQGLETLIHAAARLKTQGVPVEVRMIGHGVERPRLAELARTLQAPVSVHGRIPHEQVAEHYAWADTVIVSLRDWEPFAWTVPSKLYELFATGRHVTALVDGESAELVHAAGVGDVVPPEDVEALADLWCGLQQDRSRVAVRDSGRAWVQRHADDDVLARDFLELLGQVTHG